MSSLPGLRSIVASVLDLARNLILGGSGALGVSGAFGVSSCCLSSAAILFTSTCSISLLEMFCEF